jgi:hypothetical protein
MAYGCARALAESLWLNHDRSRAIGSRIDMRKRSWGTQYDGSSSGMRAAATGVREYRGVPSTK